MRFIYELMGAYLDALAGLRYAREKLSDHQNEMISRLKSSEPEHASEEFMDKQTLTHEFEPNGESVSRPLHRTTQGEFKLRTAPGGLDARILGFMMLALLYAAWEDKYRAKLAITLGYSEKNDLKSELFGELGKMRNAAIHNHGVATDEVARAKILQWFQEGELMVITIAHIDSLFDHMDTYITQLCGIRSDGEAKT